MKKLIVGLTVGLMMSGGVAWAENVATYNASTGVVNMPKVAVGTDYYNVDMAQQGQGLDFLVTTASPATSSSSENVATYNANNHILHIPTVIVGANQYTADLAQIGEGYNFSVTSAVLQPIVPGAFSTAWLSGKTLYPVSFGSGQDSNGNDIQNVAVVGKAVFGSNGTVQYTGLLHSLSGSFSYNVNNAGLLYNGGNSLNGNTIVNGSTSDYIKTEYTVNGVFDNVDLFFYDQSAAMDYANNLHASIPRY